jgi:hypothetical protein
MAVTYDETVIIEFATRLYRQAASMVAVCALFGAVLGALVAAIGASWYATRSGHPLNLVPVLVVGVVGGALGAVVGNNRAFALRLMAQTALCQMQIERNTRPAGVMGRAQPPPIPRGA